MEDDDQQEEEQQGIIPQNLACSEEISSNSSNGSCIVVDSKDEHSSKNNEEEQPCCGDLEQFLNMETCHFQYCKQLQNQEFVTAARSNAVQWMIKVRNVYGFTPLTVALSVNYFDRYLAKELHRRAWKSWMIELLSVSCISLAAKMEESCVPILPDLQIEGLEHVFESKTIQRMELTVMKMLDWRMNSVTAFSFIENIVFGIQMTRHLRILLLNRINEIILGTLSEVEFLEFRPSVVAVCATMFALEEAVPLQADDHKRTMAKILPLEENKVQSCYKLMEELVVDPVYPTHLISSSQVLNFDNNSNMQMQAAAAATKSPVDVIAASSGISQQHQQVWKHDVVTDHQDDAKLNSSTSSGTETNTGTSRSSKRKLDEFLMV